MALFKIFKGLKDNLPKDYHDGYCYVTIDDGKMYIDTTNDVAGRIVLNASHADTATMASRLDSNAGSATLPVYFSGGVPVATGTSLGVSVTGSAAKWTTARVFKVTDSDATNSGASINVDGSAAVTLKLPSTIKATLSGKATTAGTADAAKKLNSDAGSTTLPVYFSGGVPVATGDSLAVNITKNAATATKLATAKALAITDADGTNEGTGFDFDGSAGGTFKLPATIKANITGNLTGKADSADKLTVNGGDVNTPVYFTAGIPTPCTSLDLNTSGNAATATKWQTARNFYIADSDGTNTGVATSVNGTANATIKLPATIKATLSGKATSAGTADKLDANGGSATVPVYFDAGVPTPCTSLSLNTTGSAAKWTTARSFTITDGTNTSTGVNVDGSGNVSLKLPTTIKATLSGNASSATTAVTASKLDTDAGGATVPVYFDAGVPTPCTSLSLNTTGNAATATNVAWSGVTSKPSYYDAKAIKSISRSGTTFTATHLDGTTSTFDQQDNNTTYTALKNPYAITIQGNGTTLTNGTYDGSAAKTVNITPAAIGALPSGGTAVAASKLATARTISLTGDVTGSGSFDGSGNLSITATVADNSHNHSYLPLGGGTMTGPISFNANGACQIRNGGNDVSPTVGGELGNIVIDSWYGISFTTSCSSTYQNKTAIGFDCRNGIVRAASVYGAVWNDYAEYRTQKEIIEPGYCVASSDNGQVYKTTEKFQACDGIVSDTFGFAIGETDECKTPLAVAGRVLAYCEGDRYSYHSGDTVCAGPNGKVVKMTREEIREWPDRIIGIVSEIPEYETWGTGNVAVNGRIWIKVK